MGSCEDEVAVLVEMLKESEAARKELMSAQAKFDNIKYRISDMRQSFSPQSWRVIFAQAEGEFKKLMWAKEKKG